MKDKIMGLLNFKAFRFKIYYYGLISLLIVCPFIRKRAYADICGNAKANDAYKEGISSFKEKLYNAARQHFEKALRYDPDCVEAHFQLGLTYTYLIPYQDQALNEFKKVQELVPNSRSGNHVKAVFNEGLALLRMGAYEEAITALRKVKDLDPTYKDLDKLHNYLGVAFYFLDNYEGAIREFKRAIQENATYREANFNLKSVNMRLLHFNVGVTYGFMGNYRQAIEELNKAIEIDTNFFNAHMEIARIYVREGMYGDAISELIRCERINPNHRNIRKVYMNLGIAYYHQGSPRIAVEYLRKALRIRPDYEDAIKNLRSIFGGYNPIDDVKWDPNTHKDEYIKAYMEIARDYYMVGVYDKAVAVCNKILDIDFQNKEAADLILTSYFARADFYIGRKDYSKAIKALKALLKITPNDVTVWDKLGISYFSMPGNYWYKEAEAAFKKVIAIGGEEELIGECHYYIAQIYYAKKKNEEARDAIDLAIRNNPDNPEYHFLAAKIYVNLNMLDDAESEIKQAIEINSEDEKYSKLLREIKKLQIQRDRGLGINPEETFEDVIVEDYGTLIKRGISYVKREGYEKALDVFRNALDANSAGMEAHNNIGACLLYEGKYNEAFVEFMVSDSMSPKDAEIHINLAIAYYFLGDYKSAKDEYLKAIAIDSNLAKDKLLIKLLENGTIPAKEFLPKIKWKTLK